MSDYSMKVRNVTTGEIKNCACADDYFGRHLYGYFIDGVKEALTHTELAKEWERVDE